MTFLENIIFPKPCQFPPEDFFINLYFLIKSLIFPDFSPFSRFRRIRMIPFTFAAISSNIDETFCLVFRSAPSQWPGRTKPVKSEVKHDDNYQIRNLVG